MRAEAPTPSSNPRAAKSFSRREGSRRAAREQDGGAGGTAARPPRPRWPGHRFAPVGKTISLHDTRAPFATSGLSNTSEDHVV